MGFFSSLFGKSQTTQNGSVQKEYVDLKKVFDDEKALAKTAKMLVPEKETYNILILPVSTFNGKLSINTYKFENVTGLYASQMEPVAKYLGGKVHLDQIILLTTNKAVNEKKTAEELGLSSYTKSSVSAVEFLKDRLACVFGQADSTKCNFAEICMQDEKDNYITEKVVYKLFSELEKHEGHINVYMDIHGGFRDNQIVLSGIMSLLKNDYRLHIKKIYSLQYDPYEKAGIIIDSSDRLDIFDFTSGMSEFVKYGSVSAFETFNKNKNNTPAEKEFTSLLNDISDAISLCNVNAFDDALVELRNKKNTFAKELKDTYYGVFLSRLIDQYKVMSNGVEYNLLDSAGTKWSLSKFITQVSWCLDKGMAQQALTLIESKTGEVLANEGVIYSAEEYNHIRNKSGAKLEFRNNEKKNSKGTVASDYFTHWVNSNIVKAFPYFMAVESLLVKSEEYGNIIKVDKSKTTRENYNGTYKLAARKLKKNDSEPLEYMRLTGTEKEKKLLIPFNLEKFADDEKKEMLKKIYVFGFLFKQIKLARNDVNHASESNKITISDLTGLCEILVYSLTELVDTYNS